MLGAWARARNKKGSPHSFWLLFLEYLCSLPFSFASFIPHYSTPSTTIMNDFTDPNTSPDLVLLVVDCIRKLNDQLSKANQLIDSPARMAAEAAEARALKEKGKAREAELEYPDGSRYSELQS